MIREGMSSVLNEPQDWRSTSGMGGGLLLPNTRSDTIRMYPRFLLDWPACYKGRHREMTIWHDDSRLCGDYRHGNTV